MSTQMQRARAGEVTPEIAAVAESEFLSAEELRSLVASGRVVVPANIGHKSLKPMGIGRSLRTKINANIGNSTMSSCPRDELVKLQNAIRYGADTVMDLSTGSNIMGIRQQIIRHSTIPVGTVPIYETLARADGAKNLTAKLIMEVIQDQAAQGVDYMTIHCGILREHLPFARKRKMRIVSRGGAILARWMVENQQENPFFTQFDDILEICQQHDVTLSLGDGLRPGCLADATDEAQLAELHALGQLVQRCRQAGVQAMVEGPGHVPFDEIEANMLLERKICDDAPFYILGPVVTDCAPGYDHITSAIGATMGAFCGAAMLCYVTPKEHIGLPNAEDVRNGCIAYKIAAHAADIALHRPHARDRDDAISDARVAFDWERQFELALDPDRARQLREDALQEAGKPETSEHAPYCTMCGPDFCSVRISKNL